MTDNQFLADHAFAQPILTPLSVDKILLPKPTNFGGVPIEVKIAPFCLKHINSILFAPHR